VKYAKGPGNTEVRDVPIPAPASGEALVRVRAAAVCASDVHIVHDRFPHCPPLVLGHEFAGVVVQLGSEAEGVTVGDRVVSENNPEACGTCRVCQKGYPNLCSKKKAIGFRSDGCFAEYVKVPAALLHRVPDGVSFEAAALSEPLAVAVHAVEDRACVESGDTVVVLGPGAVGLLAAQVARAEGAVRVLVAGTNLDEELRLACARRLGFETFNVETGDLAELVMQATAGLGADLVVEASGAPSAVALGARLLRRAGRLVAVGLTGRPDIPVAWDSLVACGVTVHFSFSSRPRNWKKAMEYLGTGKVDTGALVTARFPLAQWEKAFAQMERLESLRNIFEPEAGR